MKMKLYKALSFATILVAVGCMGSGGPSGGGGGGGGGGGMVTVTLANSMTFTPQIVMAHAGDTIHWVNSGALHHTVKSDTGQAGLSSDPQFPSGLGLNDTFDWPVPANATVGTNFFYHCEFHGAPGNGMSLGTGMCGEISVD